MGWTIISDVSRYLIPFVQCKKRENTHGEVLLLVKVTLLHGRFSRFLHCINGTQIAQSVTYFNDWKKFSLSNQTFCITLPSGDY